MIFELSIYQQNVKNFTIKGRLSKRAKKAKGSMIEVTSDGEQTTFKCKDLEKYGYSQIRTGYIDSSLYMLDADGIECVAYASVQMAHWPNAVPVGFSQYMK